MSLVIFLTDFYTFWASAIYTKGETPFPQFSGTMMLNDVRVVYYNGETDTFIGRGNTTNEESVYNSNELHNIGQAIQNRWAIVENFHKPEGKHCLYFYNILENT